jgi:hypothetical protein
VFTAPDELRQLRAGHDVVVHGIKTAATILARRVQALDVELDAIDVQLFPLVKAAAPGMLNIFGVGVDTAAVLIVAAGDNPQRILSESAWAMICRVAPIPVMSGKIDNRYRLNSGGNRLDPASQVVVGAALVPTASAADHAKPSTRPLPTKVLTRLPATAD